MIRRFIDSLILNALDDHYSKVKFYNYPIRGLLSNCAIMMHHVIQSNAFTFSL